MTVQQLIDLLTDLETPDATVRLMTQQTYPFENAIAGITTLGDFQEFEDEDGEEVEPDADPETVYILEGRQIGYGSKAAWDAKH